MTERPNIIVFLTDDHGQWAANCYGCASLHTPTMDRLAQTGARLTRAFTPSPVCSPARACFFTGRFPSQHGIHDWVHEYHGGRSHPGLTGQTLISELLRDGGYQTALVGKWHCGDSRRPAAGFDRWFSFYEDQYPHAGEIHFSDQGELVVEHGRRSALITDRALAFLRERDHDRPYFMTVGYVDTHSPFSGHAERLAAHYRRQALDDIPREARPALYGEAVRGRPTDDAEHHEALAQYYASVTAMDEQMGRILDELEARGELDNTLIVYTSDHGHMNGQHDLYCKGNATTPQNFFDESILVPCLMSWPARIAAGQVCEQFVDHCDLFATVLDAAGVALDEAQRAAINSPGRSFLPLLDGRDPGDDWRDAQVCEYGNARMIRTRDFKLVRRYPTPVRYDCDELYDLRVDPRETLNRIDLPGLESVFDALRSRLNAFFAEYEDPQRSGKAIMHQPMCSGHEPWRRGVAAD